MDSYGAVAELACGRLARCVVNASVFASQVAFATVILVYVAKSFAHLSQYYLPDLSLVEYVILEAVLISPMVFRTKRLGNLKKYIRFADWAMLISLSTLIVLSLSSWMHQFMMTLIPENIEPPQFSNQDTQLIRHPNQIDKDLQNSNNLPTHPIVLQVANGELNDHWTTTQRQGAQPTRQQSDDPDPANLTPYLDWLRDAVGVKTIWSKLDDVASGLIGTTTTLAKVEQHAVEDSREASRSSNWLFIAPLLQGDWLVALGQYGHLPYDIFTAKESAVEEEVSRVLSGGEHSNCDASLSHCQDVGGLYYATFPPSTSLDKDGHTEQKKHGLTLTPRSLAVVGSLFERVDGRQLDQNSTVEARQFDDQNSAVNPKGTVEDIFWNSYRTWPVQVSALDRKAYAQSTSAFRLTFYPEFAPLVNDGKQIVDLPWYNVLSPGAGSPPELSVTRLSLCSIVLDGSEGIGVEVMVDQDRPKSSAADTSRRVVPKLQSTSTPESIVSRLDEILKKVGHRTERWIRSFETSAKSQPRRLWASKTSNFSNGTKPLLPEPHDDAGDFDARATAVNLSILPDFLHRASDILKEARDLLRRRFDQTVSALIPVGLFWVNPNGFYPCLGVIAYVFEGVALVLPVKSHMPSSDYGSVSCISLTS